MGPVSDLLFVYGTLRPALARGEPATLVQGLPCLGPATVRGTLHDLGDYPGLVAGEGLVHGDLLAVATADQLVALDAYEECGGPRPLFVRTRAAATRPDGSVVAAWVYLFARSVGTARPIAGGDYAAIRAAGPSLPG